MGRGEIARWGDGWGGSDEGSSSGGARWYG